MQAITVRDRDGRRRVAELRAAEVEPGLVTHAPGRTGAMSVSMVTRSGKTSGLQSITVRQDARKGAVSIVLTGGTTFVKGDAFALQYEMGFSPAAAAAAAGRWIKAKGGTTEPKSVQAFYESAAASLTVRSAVGLMALSGPITLVPSLVAVNGTLTLPFKMTATVPKKPLYKYTLYMSQENPSLPVEQVLTIGTDLYTAMYGPWGKAPFVVAPTSPSDMNSQSRRAGRSGEVGSS